MNGLREPRRSIWWRGLDRKIAGLAALAVLAELEKSSHLFIREKSKWGVPSAPGLTGGSLVDGLALGPARRSMV